MKPQDDPTPELYKMLDQAGLIGSNILNSRKSTANTVNEIRGAAVALLKSYIVKRDHRLFNEGYHAANPMPVKKIDVKESK